MLGYLSTGLDKSSSQETKALNKALMDNMKENRLILSNFLNESYFQGTESGGFARMYFVYYSEFSENREILSGVEATLVAILFLLSIIGNSIILLESVRKRNRNKFTNCFLGNLAFADILFVLTAPLLATTRISQSWVLGTFLCHMMMYVMFICGSVSIWTLTTISFERYQLIVKQKNRPMSPSQAIFIIVTQWLTASLAFSPVALFFNERTFQLGENSVQICTLIWPPHTSGLSLAFSIVSCAVLFVIPLVMMSRNYFRIFRKFWRSRKAVRSGTIPMDPGRWAQGRQANQTINLSRQQRRNDRDFRVVRMLFLLVGLFFVMWTPVFICLMGIQVDGTSHTGRMHSGYIMAATCVAYANTCINPVIYGMINRNLGRNLLNCRSCLSPQRHIHEGDSIYTISGQ